MAEMPFERVLAAIDRLTGRQCRRLGREVTRTSDERLVLATLNGPAFRPPACPQCDGRRLQRWGQASGLQRYRCTACLRTCNPLTGTPLARLRRRDLWLGHAAAMGEGASLRTAARRLGVHHHTTFRWRHRWLVRPARAQAQQLGGIVEVAAVPFHPTGESWPTGCRVAIEAVGTPSPRPPPRPTVHALIVCDRRAGRADALLPGLDGPAIAAVLLPLVGAAPAVLCSTGEPAFATAAQAIGVPHRLAGGRCDDGSGGDLENVRGHVERLTAWMRRFRGVSTRYLAHYLGWRRALEREPFGPGLATWLSLAIGAGPTANVDEAGDGCRVWGGRGSG
jgi:transposase-like protein